MVEVLGLEADQSVEYGTRQCQDLSRVAQRIINDGNHYQISILRLDHVIAASALSEECIEFLTRDAMLMRSALFCLSVCLSVCLCVVPSKRLEIINHATYYG